MTPDRMSVTEARRIAIAAQNLGCETRARPGTRWAHAGHTDRSGARRPPDRLGQRARAGAVPSALRATRRVRPRAIGSLRVEATVCAALRILGAHGVVLPADRGIRPLLFRWRMERARKGIGTYGRIARFAKEQRAYLEARSRGGRESAARIAASGSRRAKKAHAGWWVWSDAKHAVETLFWQASARGRARGAAGFERRLRPARTRVSVKLLAAADANRRNGRIAELDRDRGTGARDRDGGRSRRLLPPHA